MERLQATFLLVIYIISVLKVMEFALLMNVSWFCMVWTSLRWSWTRHNRYNPHKHYLFPQTAPIVGTQILAQTQKE